MALSTDHRDVGASFAGEEKGRLDRHLKETERPREVLRHVYIHEPRGDGRLAFFLKCHKPKPTLTLKKDCLSLVACSTSVERRPGWS